MRGKLLASWASAAILMASPLLVMLPEPTNAQLDKSVTQTEGQVRNAVLNQLINNNRVPNESYRISKIVVVGNYAYVNWEQGEYAGGYAIAIKKQGVWQAIIHGDDWGGIKVLEQDGIPRAAAERLLDRAMPDWRQSETAQAPRASICPWAGTEIYRQAETKNFKVYICSAEGNYNSPKYYLGIAKDNSNRIALPVSDYDPENEIYAARNGSYTYVLRMRVGDLMVITPSGKRYIENLFEVGD